ncbi:O-sialoglycoprotein endopeptidase [Heliorestis acidaminivorans]|uniref:N(6)-L-threonylcarbamoyladenine synthase n=1 Tax=Heliorestis acidaminivorans TaxID=553427 RepID=A0A6I0ES98_9FIRM|nr:O-sialoglycoprotein endopeptidase [Heliorestis acidaminivorans]KAB2951681.1 O-sialoglycoprotein endopeptidase [Heliorestis acidaminivorans]
MEASKTLRGVLGFDTSCYTTSIAFVDETGAVRAERRRMLPVKKGERGLRQGDAFFLHGQHLPELLDELLQDLRQDGKNLSIDAIAYSARPRRDEQSYLPVFRAGRLVAHTLARTLEVPLVETSHQEGHLMAGLYSSQEVQVPEEWLAEPFLAVHLSGGTTELLRVTPAVEQGLSEEEGGQVAFHVQTLGATLDLHAGQLVDRVGVALGLPFPSGPYLEKLATSATGDLVFPAAVKGYNLSFSGVETAALRMIKEAQVGGPEIARAVERCIASSLEKILRKAVETEKIPKILIVGGVAANAFLRQRLRYRLEHKAVGAQLAFATAQLSGDNAVGVALIGWRSQKKAFACR